MNMKNLIASGLATLAAMFRRKEAFLSNKQKKLNGHSIGIQFPVNKRLPDGRHRYYMKHGTKMDRLTEVKSSIYCCIETFYVAEDRRN